MFSDPYILLSSSVGQKTMFHHSAALLVFWYSFSLHWAYRSISHRWSNFILVGDFDVDVSNHLHPKVSTLPDLFTYHNLEVVIPMKAVLVDAHFLT